METRRHIIHTKEKKRPPSETRAPDRVRRPLWRGAWMTEQAPRDRCRLPAPSWCDGGRALSGALLTGAQAARQSWQSGASRPHPSCLDPDHRTQDSPKTRKRQKSPPHTTHTTWRPRRRNHHDEKHTHMVSCAPLYPSVTTPRSSLFIAPPPPPPFQLLREASRKGACPFASSPCGARGAERFILGPGPGRFIPPK